MADKNHPLGFVFKDGRVTGPLKRGIEIAGVVHKDFEMREATVEDLLQAEQETSVANVLGFNAALIAILLVRLGTFDGTITAQMLGRMKQADWRILRAAQTELDDLGEALLGDSAESLTASS